MAMSRGTSTFLTCFTGFWLLWALVAVLCCLCGTLRRRLKSGQEHRLRERCLRTMEMEPLDCPPPLHAFCSPLCLSTPGPLTLPEAHWLTIPDGEQNPPCYEEAVLMDDPPPSYTEVCTDPLHGRGIFLKHPQQAPALSPWEVQGQSPEPALLPGSSKPPAPSDDRGYCSLTRLPSAQRWDALGQLLSSMDLSHNVDHRSLPPEARTQSELLGFSRVMGIQGFQELHRAQEVNGPDPGWGLPTVFPMLGRSTAV